MIKTMTEKLLILTLDFPTKTLCDLQKTLVLQMTHAEREAFL